MSSASYTGFANGESSFSSNLLSPHSATSHLSTPAKINVYLSESDPFSPELTWCWKYQHREAENDLPVPRVSVPDGTVQKPTTLS